MRGVERAEPIQHQSFRLTAARYVVGDRGEEVAPVEGEKPERRPGADGRRSHRVVQQSDLAEPLSGAQSGNQAAVADHLDLAVLDHVEPIAMLALVEDLLTRGKLDLVDMQGK